MNSDEIERNERTMLEFLRRFNLEKYMKKFAKEKIFLVNDFSAYLGNKLGQKTKILLRFEKLCFMNEIHVSAIIYEEPYKYIIIGSITVS